MVPTSAQLQNQRLVPTYTRTQAHTHASTHTRTHTHTRTDAHRRTCTRSLPPPLTHTNTQTDTETHRHTHTTLTTHNTLNPHTHTHTHTHTVNRHTRTHTHTHAQAHINTYSASGTSRSTLRGKLAAVSLHADGNVHYQGMAATWREQRDCAPRMKLLTLLFFGNCSDCVRFPRVQVPSVVTASCKTSATCVFCLLGQPLVIDPAYKNKS